MQFLIRCLTAVMITAGFTACSDPSASGEITEVRQLTGDNQEVLLVEDPAKRYRLPTQFSSAGGAPSQGGGDASMPFVWETPEGWQREQGRAMRDLSFTFGENAEGECYLSRLPGAGGGLTPNVNRWRGQMGQPPLKDEDVSALPKKSLFGLEGTFVDVSGDFSGMGSADAKKNYRLLGVILTSDAGAVFVKMTGPADLIASNEEKFYQFCASLQPRS